MAFRDSESGDARWARRSGTRRRRRSRVGWAFLPALVLGVGCAQIESPSGGPEDRTPPRVAGTYPDSGAVNVPLADSLVLLFSEPMVHSSVEESFFLSPPIGYRERYWKGQRWILRLNEPLSPGRTYVALLGTRVKDRHGLSPPKPWSFAFTTGDSLDTGEVSGKVLGSRYVPKGVMIYVWPWADGPPDTTKEGFPPDPLRLGQADDQGAFTLGYLPRRQPLRLCALYDQDHDQQYNPASDHWGCLDTALVIADTARVVSGVQLYLTYADEPGIISGAAVDSSCVRSSAGKELRSARADRDSLRGWLDRQSLPTLRLDPVPGPDSLGSENDSLAITMEDSLRIGRQLISVDSLLSRAAAESAYCAHPLVVRLYADTALVREAKGKGEFAWNDVPAGVYRLEVFRDENENNRADPEEPSFRYPFALEVRPLRVLDKLHLELKRKAASP